MKVFTVFLGFVTAVVALNTVEIAKHVNSLGTTWKATENPIVTNITQRLGAIMPGDKDYLELPVRSYSNSRDLGAEPIPESFDVRVAWPGCANVTSIVMDQSSCGSCWSFGSTTAFTDRYCIATGDNTKIFSPADTLACCSGLRCGGSKGCNGGSPQGAWKFFESTGVVEGGLYGDTSRCEPYPFPSCAHHVDSTTLPSCDTVPDYETPSCDKKCEYGSVPYSKDKYFAKSSYSLRTVEDMQRDLMKYGTISVALQVYEDFETYSSGVYQHVSGKYLGGHSVTALGWGVENGTPYWLCRNSWNSGWGEQGYFKILRNSDECGIESSVVAGEV
jgi:cathepsin B